MGLMIIQKIERILWQDAENVGILKIKNLSYLSESAALNEKELSILRVIL